MTRILVVILCVAVVVACSKDKAETRPTLKLRSIGGNVVPAGSVLLVELDFTDKEGDVNNSLFVQKIRTNKQTTATIRDTFSLPVPEFPKNTKGIIQAQLDYSSHLTSAINPPKDPITNKNQHDTLLLRFVLRDRAGNVSDTVAAGPIVVLR
jgi:hypothetical protein